MYSYTEVYVYARAACGSYAVWIWCFGLGLASHTMPKNLTEQGPSWETGHAASTNKQQSPHFYGTRATLHPIESNQVHTCLAITETQIDTNPSTAKYTATQSAAGTRLGLVRLSPELVQNTRHLPRQANILVRTWSNTKDHSCLVRLKLSLVLDRK
jgi:hypothetical protein